MACWVKVNLDTADKIYGYIYHKISSSNINLNKKSLISTASQAAGYRQNFSQLTGHKNKCTPVTEEVLQQSCLPYTQLTAC
jgi:hypothetical protein